jgi:3-hydroxyisobutyrate dehydrogenase-like beta-hydroxyacid dehydrogenase
MRIGFIGLGVQGKHLAVNLCAAGHEVMVFDLRPEPLVELTAAGAKAGKSPREVAAFAEATATCVRDDAQTRSVMLGDDGVLAGAAPGSIVLIHSTVSPSTVLELAKLAKGRGVELVDAPVSGGERGAKAREMSYMVGGSPEVVDRCLPLFEASGSKITRTGPVGTAMQAKVVHQLIICVNMLAASEGMRLGLAAGLTPEVLTQVVREGGAQSRMADNWFTLKLRPHAVSVFDKDLDLCLQMAGELGMAAPGAELAKRKIEEIIP